MFYFKKCQNPVSCIFSRVKSLVANKGIEIDNCEYPTKKSFMN